MKQTGNYGTGLTLSGLPNLKQLLVWPGEGFTDKSNSKSTQVFYCTVYFYVHGGFHTDPEDSFNTLQKLGEI